MTSGLQDIRFAVRALGKRPGTTVLAVVAFALGIGLCTTMFSIIYGVYFRGIGVPEADRLVLMYRTNLSENITDWWVPQHDYYDWREQQQSFEGLAAYYSGTVNLSGTDTPERYDGAFVTANLFDLLRVRPVVGSFFRDGDDRPGAPLTVVLGYEVWQTRFRGDSSAVGRTVRVNSEQATVIGVAPPGFRFPETQEVWVPQRDIRGEVARRGYGNWSRVMGRLAPGVTREQAEREMNLVAERLGEAYPETNAGLGVRFSDFVEAAIGDDANPVFLAMQVATFFVLLIACGNVANLLLARAALRTREAAVRTAIGATRFRVALPYLAEALVLSVVGAGLGLGIAWVGIELFDRVTTGVGKPYFMEFALDLPILGFVAGVTAVTAVVSGVAPAWQIARADVNAILKDENRGSSSLRAGRLSRILVVGQVSLSCALLVGAGLMAKSIAGLSTYEFAFETDGIFTARVALFPADYPDRASRQRFFQDLEDRLRTVPRVESVAITSSLPIGGSGGRTIAIEGETYATESDHPNARMAEITTDFFDVFGVDVLRGRGLTRQDVDGSLPVALVNQRFEARHFPDGAAVGRRIRMGTGENAGDWLTIVGVVPNLRMEGFPSPPQDSAGFYVPLQQSDVRYASIALGVAGGNPLSITPAVRAAVRAVDPDLPIYFVQDMDAVFHQETWFYQVFGTLFVVFGLAALFLASVGLYGVLAFSVSRRIQEMGIRMALGANAAAVRRLVLKEGAVQLGVGLGVGLPIAFGLSNVLTTILFGVEPRDPVVFGSIVVVIAAVGVVASLVPARRATRVDPVVALRYD